MEICILNVRNDLEQDIDIASPLLTNTKQMVLYAAHAVMSCLFVTSCRMKKVPQGGTKTVQFSHYLPVFLDSLLFK